MNKQLKDDLVGHTHNATTGKVELPAASSSSSFSSFLPLLMLQPNCSAVSPRRRARRRRAKKRFRRC
jgi:hypothetical protein